MATSRRITNNLRDEFVEHITTEVFKERKEELAQRNQALFARVWRELLGEETVEVISRYPHLFEVRSEIYLGLSSNYSRTVLRRGPFDARYLAGHVPSAGNLTNSSGYVPIDACSVELESELRGYIDDMTAYEAARDGLRRELRAFFLGFATVKALLEAWPDLIDTYPGLRGLLDVPPVPAVANAESVKSSIEKLKNESKALDA